MTLRLCLCVAALAAAAASVAFAMSLRLPMPFEGFAVVVAAGLAGLLTLTVLAWMPVRWLWSDAEQLRFAFQARHGLSAYSAGSALEAITSSHDRANALRRAARVMREDVATEVGDAADRLDAAAREIFYAPERHRDLRAVLIRSELIETAAQAHAKLRKRAQPDTEAASRTKLRAAVEALQAAFDQTDLLAAKGLLGEVEAASGVAETLLKPRRARRADAPHSNFPHSPSA